jgi:glycerol-3-phosphate acyltransferase PlsY
MEYLVSSIVGLLLGSIPSAYLIVRISSGVNILESGSGNAGAFNSYEVSNSKLVGLFVLIADAAKGSLAVLVTLIIFPNIFLTAGLALLFAVFSHCFNPWFSFRGGRGLATAAGGAGLLIPYLLVVWAILWVIFYLMKKDIHLSNITATIMSLLLLFATVELAIKYTFFISGNIPEVILLSTSVLLIIFIKHIEPLRELMSKVKSKGKS